MKDKIDSRFYKMLSVSAIFTVVNTLLAIGLSIYLVYIEIDTFDFSAVSIFLCGMISFCIEKVLNLCSSAFLKFLFYGSDTETLELHKEQARQFVEKELNENSSESTINQDISDNLLNLKIAQLKVADVPDNHIGLFLDEKIYEWIDFSKIDNPEKFRAYFEGTVNLEKQQEFTIPDGCILIPPGLIYRVNNV